MKKYIIGSLIIASSLVLGACSSPNMNGHDMSEMNGNKNEKTKNEKKLNLIGLKEGQPMRTLRGPEINLIAKEGKQTLKNGVVVQVWTFNGAAPGPEIRVKKGEKVLQM